MTKKPDWKDAPEWAQWLAMDASGRWCWFETEPVFCGIEMAWVFPPNAPLKARCQNVLFAHDADASTVSAKKSMEPRP